MYCPEVFLITKRKELGIKHKKLIEGLNCAVSLFSKLDEAIFAIQTREPEMIIISDTIEDDLADFIKKIRILTCNYRPVILALSKSDNIDDKLASLEAGGDDFLNEDIQSKEFQARINAHIRRHLENSLNPITNFIDTKTTNKFLKKLAKSGLSRAVMLVNISGINFYKEIYGEIAYEKVLQTLGAIINSTMQKEDVAGHYSNKEFILITSFLKAEKIAKFLTFAFDSILERFYSEFDYKNNFMLYSSETKEEKKIPLMKLSIAVVETGERFENEKQILSMAFNVLKLCKSQEKSCYIIDRPRLSGKVSAVAPKNRVMIMEKDEALNYLLNVSLKMRGFEVESCLNYEEFLQDFEEFLPDVLILDYGDERKKQGFEALLKAKEQKSDFKIIFSTTIQNKKEILSKGADVYLPKPYDIGTLIDWVEKMLY